MARKSLSTTKKFLIIAVLLICLQVLYLVFFGLGSRPAAVDVRSAVNQVIDSQPGIDSERRSQVKLQVALSDFHSQSGRYPDSLDELTPKYFDSIPVDPETAAPFEYRLEGNRYILGKVGAATAGGGTTARTGSAARTELPQDEESALIATLDDPEETTAFIYDPSGKRDPLRSYNFSDQERVIGDTPLERFSYDELKLTAVLSGMGETKAIIEDANGRGHTVGVGTKVGNMGGEIVTIEDDHILILETTVEFTGEKSTRTIEMLLRRRGN